MPPNAGYWIESDAKTETWTQLIMSVWCWVIFLFNEFFILIVLLNFLIAIISQSFDEITAMEVVDRYQSRCSLNLEVSILIDTY